MTYLFTSTKLNFYSNRLKTFYLEAYTIDGGWGSVKFIVFSGFSDPNEC